MIAPRTWRLAAAGYAVIVFIVSVIPVDPRVAPGQLDKAAHLCEYLLLAWLLVQVFRGVSQPRKLWVSWFFATAYGALIEMVQAYVPWRSADWMDGWVNAAGAALGVLVACWIPKGNHRKAFIK